MVTGQVCAVAVNDKSYLTKVYTEANCLRLVSLNPKYDDIIIDFPPSSDTHIKIYAVIGSDKVVQG
ncbi:S24 family peptidase [Streptococcus sp. ZJ93]|uniref:S24 family peptidase n=1 Tax=Streptococcus handemini TaxID=3161188 RepID=UPI0034D7A6E2